MAKELTAGNLDTVDLLIAGFVTAYSFFLDFIPGPIDNFILVIMAAVVVILRHKMGS